MVLRVRLPGTALRHYLRPSPDREVAGRFLVPPVRREELIPAGLVLASGREVDLVELPVQVDPGDMAQGLRPGDRVQVLAAFTEGARRGRAVVLLPAAEVVQLLQDPTGLTGAGQERGVQLRMPGDRAPVVAAAIATARIFVVKAPGPAPGAGAATGQGETGQGDTGQGDTGPAGTDPVPPTQPQSPPPATFQPEPSQPEPSQPGSSRPGVSPTELVQRGGTSPPGRIGVMREVVTG
jgi:hypothetical protein